MENTDDINPHSQLGVCDVHRLVNKDYETREVQYCGLCDAWMCDECWHNYPKRALAASIKMVKGE